MTNHNKYYYEVMTFGLKNTGVTYQILVDNVFAKQISRSLEVYIDDMVFKNPKEGKYVDNLGETLTSVIRYNMHMNPNKYSIVVYSRKFPGFMLTRRGIEAIPDNVRR